MEGLVILLECWDEGGSWRKNTKVILIKKRKMKIKKRIVQFIGAIWGIKRYMYMYDRFDSSIFYLN